MAWSSKKQYAIMMSSEEGKDLAEKMPDLSQDEFNVEFSKLLGKNEIASKPDEAKQEKPEPKKETKYVFKITPKHEEDVKKKLKYVFRKADKEDFEIFMDDIKSCGENEKALFFQAMYETVNNVYQGKGEGYFSAFEKKIILDRANLTEETSYVRNGVAFHEFGHAIDYSIGGGISKGSYASLSYKNKNGDNIKSLLQQECNSCDWQGLKEEIASMKQKNSEKIKNFAEKINTKDDEIWNFRQTMKEEAKENFTKKYGISPQEYADVHNLDKYEDDDSEARKNFLIARNITWGETDYTRLFASEETTQKYDNARDERKKLYNEYKNVAFEVKQVYGDISDIYSGFTKNARSNSYGLNDVDMGHSTSYWNDKGDNALPKECFAELFEGKTVNPRSYQVMKRYFPHTVELFEEIISTYGENYAKRFGDNNE